MDSQFANRPIFGPEKANKMGRKWAKLDWRPFFARGERRKLRGQTVCVEIDEKSAIGSHEEPNFLLLFSLLLLLLLRARLCLGPILLPAKCEQKSSESELNNCQLLQLCLAQKHWAAVELSSLGEMMKKQVEKRGTK